MKAGDQITISGIFKTFSDGHLLIVPTHQLAFTKTPKKILDAESGEAGFYSDGPLYHETTEIRLRTDGEASGDSRIRHFVTVAGRLVSLQSQGVEQLGIEVEKVIPHEEIADEAFFKYFIGLPGTAEEHWIAAEAELLARG